jgi:high affinity sulfate transporter 1
VAFGPTSAISLLVGSTLAVLSGGDPAKWLTMASLTALGVGLISILAYIIKLNSLVNFISETVLLGFKAGAALSIASTVLPDLLGIPSGGHNFFERIGNVITHIGDSNIAVLIFGLIAFGFLITGEKFFPRKPSTLIIVSASMLLMGITNLAELGFKMVGALPPGLPTINLPIMGAGEMSVVIDLSFACFVLAYIESISAARTLALEHEYEIDARQELLAVGAGNLAASLAGGYPITGGLSQSAVNDKAGARTPLALIICALVLSMLLLFLSNLLVFLPKVMLSAIVLHAVMGLFKYKELKRLFYLNRKEFIIAMVALAGVVLFGILKGVMIAALLSLALLLQQTAKPYIAVLGRIGSSNRYSDINRHQDNILIPNIVILRVESSIFYFNAQYVRDEILEKIDEFTNPVKVLILDMSSSPWVDVSGSKMLVDLNKTLHKRNIQLKIVEAVANVRDILRKQGMEKAIGHLSRKVVLHDVVNEAILEINETASLEKLTR